MKIGEVIKIALISLVVSACSLLAYDKFFATKIVTFDLKGYIAVLRDLYLTKQIDEAELKKRIDKIEEVVAKTPKRKIIITSDVILGGDRVENLTPEFKGYPTKKAEIPEPQSK
ncbi:hypothetical protein QI155_10345 [Thermodesulfovibrio sp. 1176]|uniref:hypothetical protein n=1 Tax=Thermodesulfovibrio sp. 1176 TaxID=3043424 RepID=UPI00248286E1|nr:hypothetical protein [Thermodesulfovibrio sp. 1176]MDI1472930.1 hypothetical protein [Thermodesulfovibrio sp. 1176]